MVGDIDERGRLPGSTRLATAAPSFSGEKAKSVSWLLSRKPPTIWREPKAFSTELVMDSTLPASSTMVKWLVEGMSSMTPSTRSSALSHGGSPGTDRIFGQRGRPAQQRRARLQVAGVEQALGHRHEIAVGHVAVAVGEGEARGVADDAPAFRIVGAEGGNVERLDHAEDLADGQGAGGGRTHAADRKIAIGRADGRTLLHDIGGEIFGGEPARIGLVAADCRDDACRDGPGVEGIRPAVLHRLQGRGIIRIAKHWRRRQAARRPCRRNRPWPRAGCPACRRHRRSARAGAATRQSLPRPA